MVDELGVPVKFVGVGEGIEDLQVGRDGVVCSSGLGKGGCLGQMALWRPTEQCASSRAMPCNDCLVPALLTPSPSFVARSPLQPFEPLSFVDALFPEGGAAAESEDA